MDTKLLKQKILDLAIRGKLVPQDPNDEPASVLLEKIKKEKQELIKQGKIKKDKNESTIYVGDDKQHYEKMIEDLPKNWEVIKLNEVLYYEQPTNYIVSNPAFDTSFNGDLVIGENCEIVKLTPDWCGIGDLINSYAQRVAMALSNHDVASALAKFGFIFTAKKSRSTCVKRICISDNF